MYFYTYCGKHIGCENNQTVALFIFRQEKYITLYSTFIHIFSVLYIIPVSAIEIETEKKGFCFIDFPEKLDLWGLFAGTFETFR